MKKYIILLTLTMASLLNAGSGSFWGGFGLGSFMGSVTNEICHHSHHRPHHIIVERPVRYIEVERPVTYVEVQKVQKPVYIHQTNTTLLEDLERENKQIEQENRALKRKISHLEAQYSDQPDTRELSKY